MIKALKFVQGAIAKKDFVPVLQHFRIKDKRITGFNGNVCLSSSIELDVNAQPKALPFIRAIETCEDTASIYVTEAGRLAVKSGSFRAYIPCIDEEFPDIVPEGEMIPLDINLVEILATLKPFVGEDASRPWASGILFRNTSAFVTNNIILVEYALPFKFPIDLNIPIATIREILRIKEEPTHIQVADSSVTFHFEGDRWLRSQKSSLKWPDLGAILNREASPIPIPASFYDQVRQLLPFVDELNRVYLNEDTINTSPIDDETGASVQIGGLSSSGVYHIKQLLKLENIAISIDFSEYPAPCLFFGDMLRGAIIGMRPDLDAL